MKYMAPQTDNYCPKYLSIAHYATKKKNKRLKIYYGSYIFLA